MNNILYKQKLIEKKHTEKDKYSLNRNNVYFQKYYEIKINVKYGQSKFLLSSNDIKNIKSETYAEGPGLFEGVFVKKIEQNYLYLSRPVLSYGMITISFKCKLSLGDSWLDWDTQTWQNKIDDSKSKFEFEKYNSQDSYFLRVKNHYESVCLYPTQKYYVREKEPIEVFENIYCGNSIVNTNNIEFIRCGEDAKFAGSVECSGIYNQLSILDELYCEDLQSLGQKSCDDISVANKK